MEQGSDRFGTVSADSHGMLSRCSGEDQEDWESLKPGDLFKGCAVVQVRVDGIYSEARRCEWKVKKLDPFWGLPAVAPVPRASTFTSVLINV